MAPQDVTPRTATRLAAAPQTAHGASACYLTAFDPLYAPMIASWVRSDQELTWLAPSTAPPLTAQKVAAWGRNRDHRLMFWNGLQDAPIGHTELNKMQDRPQMMWIGHFILDPAHRGRSYGWQFARGVLALAFVEYAASDVLLVVFPDNAAAIRCYKRAGMVVTGRERRYFGQMGRQHTFLRMAINRARYHELVAAGQLPARPLPLHTNGRHQAPPELAVQPARCDQSKLIT